MVALTESTPDESLTTIAEAAIRRALEGLIQLMEDPDVPPETRRKAATDALRYVGPAAARVAECIPDQSQAAEARGPEAPSHGDTHPAAPSHGAPTHGAPKHGAAPPPACDAPTASRPAAPDPSFDATAGPTGPPRDGRGTISGDARARDPPTTR